MLKNNDKNEYGRKKIEKYNHLKIEKKWQKKWSDEKPYQVKTNSKKKKFYGLMEFPYPSGDGLHVGHVRGYTAMDIICRKKRMEDYNTLYPIGYDAFGLPTENYAIKTGKQPKLITKKNTDNFKKQFNSLGMSFDWSREINTTDPAYYRWTQWIFLQFFKKGLAYKKKVEINWCTDCKIGLANEEVLDNCCERCSGQVVKKEKEQWMLGITKYADRLDKDLDLVDYPERVKSSQRNWIGRSEGSLIKFKVKSYKVKSTKIPLYKLEELDKLSIVEVFTTRADTLFGATYLVLAPEHELIKNLKLRIKNWDEVEEYIKKVKNKTDLERTENKEKTGIELKGIKAINFYTNEEIPIWVADYVLPHYGTGAVMAVPAHDERDFEFAKKFNLPIKKVIEPLYISNSGIDAVRDDISTVERNAIMAIVKHWSEDKYIGLKWKKVNWETFITGGPEENQSQEEAAIAEINEETGYLNLKLIKKLGKTHSKFFHVPKGVNRFAHFDTFYFELENGEKKELLKKEENNHEVVWLTKKELEKFNLPPSQRYAWEELNSNLASYCDDGILCNSGKFDGMSSKEAQKEITKEVGGKMVTKYKLRDWVFSRQRYWGEPIPLVFCEHCAEQVESRKLKVESEGERLNPGWFVIKDKDLPVKLPEVKNYKPTDTGESPLASISKWVNVKCPKCRGKAKRETDTMPNWAGSSWYYLRYIDPKNKKEFASKKNLNYWLGDAGGVDHYNGGMEHTTLHLLYSRFWHKFLYDLKLVSTVEPYQKRTSHGMILAEGGIKMSKSKGNVINPDDIVRIYGADTLRIYEMFIGPFEDTVAWNTESIIGSRRFLERVWRVAGQLQIIADRGSQINTDKKSQSGSISDSNRSKSVLSLLHKTIKKVTQDIESMSFNTAISSMMMFVNEMNKVVSSKEQVVSKKDFRMFLQVLAPFAPHITEELYQLLINNYKLQNKKTNTKKQTPKSIHLSLWPKWEDKEIQEDDIKIAIQINGKVRSEITINKEMTEEEIKDIATRDIKIINWLKNKEIKRFIYIPGKIINIVV